MRRTLISIRYGLALAAVIALALASFVFFNSLGQSAASPRAALTPSQVAQTVATPPATPTSVPTATRTPLPTPPPVPTAVPRPTFTAAPPTPVRTITAWLTYTNTKFGYTLTYPNTWFIDEDNLSNVEITSFQRDASGHGGIPSGSVKIDIYTILQNPLPPIQPGQKFCVDTQCGVRGEQRAPFSEPINSGLNRIISVQILRGGGLFQLVAMIAEPLTDSERNATIVEKIITSLHFTR